jgi:LPXTG-site transpeptidase (sortase) family protein
MEYFFTYLFVIVINIFAILGVLKIRRNKMNSADVITEATIVEDTPSPKRNRRSYNFFNNQQSSNIFVEFEDLDLGNTELIYDGQLLDLAVEKKIVTKKGNWYLYGDVKLGYGKDKAKFYLLENTILADEISSLVYSSIDIKLQNQRDDLQNLENAYSIEKGKQIYSSHNSLQNQQSLGIINQQLEIELSEIYVKSNTLKKVLENTLGTEVMISIDISQRFNPLITDQEKYASDIVSMLKEVDYLISAVSNISKNAKYLDIKVTEQMLREKLNLMTSNLFSIVFTKKPVQMHKNFAKLSFDEPVKKNRNIGQRKSSRQIKNIDHKQKPLAPIGLALLVVGLFIVGYSINQTFFSTSVIDDEQQLLEKQFEVNNTNLSDLRNKNLNAENSVENLEQIDEFQESFLSIATKTLTNQAAKAEFLPDVVGRLMLLSADVNHYVVFGATSKKLEYGPGYIVGTSLPGSGGNFGIAGHRTTYGAPFGNLDRVVIGDDILFQTNTNEYKYKVVDVKIVSPEETYLLGSFGDDRITLSTCHPKFSAKQRLVVVGKLEKVKVFG